MFTPADISILKCGTQDNTMFVQMIFLPENGPQFILTGEVSKHSDCPSFRGDFLDQMDFGLYDFYEITEAEADYLTFICTSFEVEEGQLDGDFELRKKKLGPCESFSDLMNALKQETENEQANEYNVGE